MSDEFELCLKNYTPIKKPGSKKAIIFVRGLLANLTEYRGLCRLLIERAGEKVDFYPFKYMWGNWFDRFSTHDPKVIANKLKNEIGRIAEGYDEVILVGHSVGTMLLRQAILTASKESPEWFVKVKRVVLLSATNRGYRITKPWDQLLYFFIKRWAWLIPMAVVGLLPVFGLFANQMIWIGLLMFLFVFLAANLPHPALLFKDLFVESIMVGADWPIGLRLAWMSLDESDIKFKIYHVLGENDQLVDAKDNIELLRFPRTQELIVDDAGHHEMKLTPRGGRKKSADQERIELATIGIDQAITDCFADDDSDDEDDDVLTAKSVVSKRYSLFKSVQSMRGDDDIDLVVFLIHGIRDFGEWQETLGTKIEDVAQAKGKKVKVVPVRYGYFSAFQFIFPNERNRVTKSFLDRYLQARSEYPGAEIAVAAHSNGTYVFAKPLNSRDLNIRADRVYLAGSVLRRTFEWSKLKNQVPLIRNDCAGADWPVGALCWLLGMIPGTGVGTGGFNGFNELSDEDANEGKTRKNNKFLEGGHGAALEPEFHREVAEFLVTGIPVNTKRKSRHNRRLFRLCILRLLFLAGVAGIVYVYTLIPTLTSPAMIVASTAIFTFVIIRLLMRL